MPPHSATSRAALSAALALAAHGFAVFPCLPTKAPACPHGHLDATNDPAGVRALWRRWPGPLIGTPTGDRNGFDVLDVDPRHGGDAWHAAHRSRLPPTRMHQTGGAGLHILFRHREGVRNSAGKIAPGIDVRGEGGFVIWWPAAGCPVLAEGGPADWPAWLLALLIPPPPRPAGARSTPDAGTRAGQAIARTLARLEMAAPGQRHARLRAAACTLGGLMDELGFGEAEAERVLFDAVRRAGGAEVVEKNARGTIAWGLKRCRRAPLRMGGR
jgi:hypothetical protein